MLGEQLNRLGDRSWARVIEKWQFQPVLRIDVGAGALRELSLSNEAICFTDRNTVRIIVASGLMHVNSDSRATTIDPTVDFDRIAVHIEMKHRSNYRYTAEPLMLTNLSRLRDLIKHEGLDAVIATCPENVTYLSGFWAMSQWVRRGPQAYVLHPKDGQEPCIIANSGILDLVPDQDIWVKEIRRYGYFQMDVDPSATLDATDRLQKQLFDSQAYKGPVEALVAAMKEKGLASGKIGLDEMGITPQCMDQLKSLLPDATFVRSFSLFERVRSVKTPAEIAILRQAARITERAIDAALAIAKEGVTERGMLRAFNACLAQNDATPVVGWASALGLR